MRSWIKPIPVLLFLVLAIVLILPSACQNLGGSTNSGVTVDTITIGTYLPLSVSEAAVSPSARVMEAYFKKVNDEGGINGRKVKLVVSDSQGKPARTIEVVKKMVEQDNVFLVYGGYGTATTMAVKDYLQERRVPLFAPVTGRTILGKPSKKMIFTIYPSYEVDGGVLASYMVERLGIKKVGIFYQNDDFGRDAVAAVEAYYKRKNISPIVEKVSYEPTTNEVSPQVVKLRQAGAEGVMLFSPPKFTALFLNEAEAVWWEPTVALHYANGDSALTKLAPTSSNGAVVSSAFPIASDLDDPKVQGHVQFMKDYLPGVEIDNHTLAAQALSEPLVEILKRAGPKLTRQSFIEAAETLKDFEGVAGRITFGLDDHVGIDTVLLYKIQAGQFVRVTENLGIPK